MLPVVAQRVDITITKVVPDSEAVRTAVETAIRNYFANTNQVGGFIYLKTLRDELNVAGLVDATITLPTDTIDLGLRNVPYLESLNVSS